MKEQLENQGLLLVVDQFEELYTLCLEDNKRQRFLDLLLNVFKEARQKRDLDFTLVITLRADFYSYTLTYRPFVDALQHNIAFPGLVKYNNWNKTVHLLL
ncbi:hypothetical protein NIES267_72160 (plasmid) [Calothrix parasitica NIES-267]|uniref:Novel STAND NTPase 1 domain-containing protein n=1 Tax=Calothrix parasitica NIES-267 TaxID=1973488 RepID=A0A1Z4M2J0_9CYAN|nr:hypothetical protein NIES267_72160 [Calothrix parasitica NIES-267]